MARDQIDTRCRPASGRFVQIGTAGKATSELIQHIVGAAPVIAHAVPVFSVPLRPQRRKVSDLIASFAEVPGFGDELHSAYDGILLDDMKKSGQSIDLVGSSRESRCEI